MKRLVILFFVGLFISGTSVADNIEEAYAAYGSGDYVTAAELLRTDAEAGNQFAQAFLGTMYDSGVGVRQDKSTAKEWFGKACDNGEQRGCHNYKILNEQGIK